MRKLVGQSFTCEITEDDIALGLHGHPFGCPVARAIERAINRPKHVVSVFPKEAALLTGRPLHRRIIGSIDLPAPILRFIKDFDKGREVKPLTFVATIEERIGDPHAIK